MMRCFVFAIGLLLPAVVAVAAPDDREPRMLLQRASRVVFLGDSITAAGQYVAYFDAWLVAQRREQTPAIIDAGLPSETVSGLSEQGHAGGQFPRPDLAERLTRVLAATKPDLVVACYGINCAIYEPLDEGRFKKYQQGIESLRSRVESAGAKLVLMTPPFYDDQRSPRPFNYNQVLDRYSDWLLDRRKEGWMVVDLHGPMTSEVTRRRASDPKFTFQPDGVHPNNEGHWFIAQQLIRWFGDADAAQAASPEAMLAVKKVPKEALALVEERVGVLRDAYVSAAGHKRPGIAAGLPVPDAEAKALELSAKIEALVHVQVKSPIAAIGHRFLIQGRDKLAIVDKRGQIEWQMPWGAIHDIHVLKDGHILVQQGAAKVAEIDPATKTVVWSYDCATQNGNSGKRVEVHAFQPLDEGRLMIAESGVARIIEIDRQGTLLKEVKLKVDHPHPHTDTRLARKLATGNYLVCHEGDGTVREYDGESGDVVWEYEVPLFGREPAGGHGSEAFGNKCFAAVRLANGNTLISTGNGHGVLEVTPAKKIVWQIGQRDLPGITLAWVTTLEVLANGHYLIGDCHAGPDNPQLIELDPKTKKVVWTFQEFGTFGNDVSNTLLLDAVDNNAPTALR